MNRFLFIILLVSVAAPRGQDLIAPQNEQVITTDSIDLFSSSRTGEKSTKAALAASLLLPGSGHHYLDRSTSAFAYLAAETASLFAFFMCSHYAVKIAQDAAGFAWIHSGANGAIKDPDDYYWKLVGNFMDTEEYNEVIDLNRGDPDDKITDESRAWRWDDESSRDHYNKLRSLSRGYKIASSFFLGALVLNRAVAFIELRTFMRGSAVKRSKQGSLRFRPSFAATPRSLGCELSATF